MNYGTRGDTTRLQEDQWARVHKGWWQSRRLSGAWSRDDDHGSVSREMCADVREVILDR